MPACFERPGLTLLPHPLGAGFYAVAIGPACVVLAPPELHDAFAALSPAALVDPEVVTRALPARSALIGPALVAYASEVAQILPEPAQLADARAPALVALRSSVSADEWRHANLDAASGAIFVARERGTAIAASGAETLLSEVAHIGVVTHPAHRKRGHGRRVVAACARAAEQAGRLAQYQTLAANLPALAVARSLGFEPLATTLAARWS